MEVEKDLYRLTGKVGKVGLYRTLLRDNGFRYLYYWRKIKSKSGLSFFYKFLRSIETKLSGIEIPLSVELGAGALLLHAFGITINSQSKIGKNVVILKGVTIGNTKRGPKAGAPTIGNNVYLGPNSSVVGGIVIGDDVIIAPNSFVNFDVPSHSVVVGNPGVIHHKKFATKGYVNNCIDNKE